MSNTSARPGFKALRTIAMISVALSLTAGIAAAAEEVTSDQILRALAPKKPLTRGLSMTPPAEPAVNAAEGKFVDSLRNRSTRSLSIGEREQIAAVAQTKPAIDLEITFDYNSANISKKSLSSVQALGKALSSEDLKGATFVVAGHTDAVGGEEYNQDLSERRADAIKRYLTDKYGIAGADLVTVGYGKGKPKAGVAPTDPSNRRVQVVNMANKTTASQ
ncbi:OmpA family protein [Tardiphaga sp. 1201_B9_N1_1]|jgi:outer membrane protein OmpA-like peptidoglycan-associated protein|uniref:OmpA family protein n=1 Tax=Tardiphaga TaxID=1395974 RepID=UPI0008A7E156|nr:MULTISPECIES: OmpA family protein [Tardiphaga]NUU45342.1 OmpA family protein [Tardiphaga robiniae]UFS74907.1 OmpA family protein [Tardiphaga sp. 37S4]WNV07709.1 OmpA family protein [Tardiphaga sp. 709]SEH86113.1 Outer membrane protein OmpA [Tardiphaga sp. OK245]SNT57187.1 Outer membrane protein OmpA [Tardiphaga sp. OK246]